MMTFILTGYQLNSAFSQQWARSDITLSNTEYSFSLSHLQKDFSNHIVVYLLSPSNFGLKTIPANKFDKGDQACSIGFYTEYLATYVDTKRRSKFSSWSKINCLLRLKVNNLGHHQIGLYMQFFSLPLKCRADYLRVSRWLMDGTWLLVGANLQEQYVVLVNELCQCCHALWCLYNLIMQVKFVHCGSYNAIIEMLFPHVSCYVHERLERKW